MKVFLNGEPREVEEPATVASLLLALALSARPVAVELNGTVIPAARHMETPLRPEDRIEIVTLVGGG